MSKHVWSSKWTFILAAIWWAAGLGNLWRFPYQVYDNGGFSFIIAYVIITLIVGISLAVWEIALWQRSREGVTTSLSKIHPLLSIMGWVAVLTALAIVFYYIVIVGWSVDYIYYALRWFIDWGFAWTGNPETFFNNNILQLTGGLQERWELSVPVLWWTIITFIALYFFTFKGAKSIGKVVWFTVVFPYIALLLIAVKGFTLPGAADGLSYLVTFDKEAFFSISTWTAALAQVFFSIWVGMAFMVIYGAQKPNGEEVAKSTIMVILWNALISVLSSLAVFTSLGYLANQQGVGVSEVAAGGPGLIFVTIPTIFSTFGGFVGPLFAVIFFLTVFFLAIDSAMALIEAPAAAIRKRLPKVKTEMVFFGVAVLAFLASIPFMYWNGLYLLDIVDYYLTQYAVTFVALFELVIFLFIWKKLAKFIQEHSSLPKWITHTKTLLTAWGISALAVLTLIILNFKNGFFNYAGYPKEDMMVWALFLWAIYVLSIIFGIVAMIKTPKK